MTQRQLKSPFGQMKIPARSSLLSTFNQHGWLIDVIFEAFMHEPRLPSNAINHYLDRDMVQFLIMKIRMPRLTPRTKMIVRGARAGPNVEVAIIPWF